MMQDERILSIQREIQEKADQYSDALNRRDWRLFETCWYFTASTQAQGTGLIYKRNDSVLSETKARLEQMDLFFQITHPGIIEVHERGAKARFSFQQWSRSTHDQRDVKTVGLFEDEWRRGHAGFYQIEKRIITVVHEEERILERKAPLVSPEAQPA